MSGEVYFDFKVKPSKKRDPKKSDQDSGEDGTNRVIAVARELRRATAKERTGPRKIRSPEGVAKAVKSRKDHEAGNVPEENPYYRGLDRNVWKLSDYANTSSVKEEPIARETSPSWEDYVPDYSSRRERNWKGIHGLSPAVLGDSEEYVPKKSPGCRKSRRNNQTSTIRSQGLPEEHNIPVGAIPAAAEPKVQCQAFYKNTGSGSPTIKEILVELIWWSVLGVALMLVLTYRSSLPPLTCNAVQPLAEAPAQQQTTVPL
ncbi:hypothetical protein Tcan_04633 [Toxocara canis]|uniref:Uncharacterized protein n=1 Tax=Toxocara canis TaxID=6265 RepID=A0A0B2VFN1_TOXCA|nr:hypothetical protein Tcan_04633 [Toxocara canis]